MVVRTLGKIVVDTWDNAISPWEPPLTVAVDSPCASLGFGEFGWVRLTNGLTSIAKVAE